MTLHDLSNDLEQYLNLTPEQKFRVTAKIKRLIHQEKSDLCGRLAMYGEEQAGTYLHDLLVDRADSHSYWATLPDEEMVTWSVGSHEYVQKKPPCSECSANLTGKDIEYASVYENGKSSHFCRPCAEKNGLWERLTQE